MTSNTGRNNWLASSHSFQQGDGKAFAQAGQDDQIGSSEQGANIFAKSKKSDPILYAQFTGQFLQLSAYWTVASDDNLKLALAVQQDRGRFYEVFQTLVRCEPRHGQDQQ